MLAIDRWTSLDESGSEEIEAQYGMDKDRADYRFRRMARRIGAIIVCGAVGAALTGARFGDGDHDREYEVKAAFVFNFAKYVDWPASSFDRADSPFVLGIVGSDPFGAIIDRTVQGKSVNGHPFAVRRVKWGPDMRSCHLLFVSPSERERVGQLPATLQGAAVFSVGETPGFASKGGVAGFFPEQGRIRFEINQDAAKRVHLSVSSKLLALARIVSDGR